MLAVDARDLTKTFRNGWLRRRTTEALRGVTLAVPRGAIYGLLGPNGAGKTTLLSILATLLIPDGGSARILGHDVVTDSLAVRARVNMASGNASFVWSLRPAEVLSFYGRLYGLSGRTLRARVDELLETFELRDHARTEYNELSTGLKQRLAFAKALLNEPEVLFLDEPTLGLDPDVSIRIRARVAALRRERGTTVILTTHYMREAEELCDEIAFIKGGRILAQGSPDALKRQIAARRRRRAAAGPSRAGGARRAARHPRGSRPGRPPRVYGGRRRQAAARDPALAARAGRGRPRLPGARARARGGLR